MMIICPIDVCMHVITAEILINATNSKIIQQHIGIHSLVDADAIAATMVAACLHTKLLFQ